MTLETYNDGVSLTTNVALTDLPNGWYRIRTSSADVTVTASVDGGSTYYNEGTVTSAESEDIYIGGGTYLKCTFASGTATIQRLQGRS